MQSTAHQSQAPPAYPVLPAPVFMISKGQPLPPGFVLAAPMDPFQQAQQQTHIQGPPGGTEFMKLPEEEQFGQPGVDVSQTGLERGAVADEILSQDYQINMPKWFSESWAIYKQHWIAFVLFTIFQLAVGFLPYIGFFVTFPLTFGIFIAVTNKIRYNGLNGDMRYDHFLFGFLFIVPLLAMTLVEGFLISLGLLLCILPGLYAIVALAFAIPVFLEYHNQNIGIIGSMQLSTQVVNKHLLEVALFLLANAVFMACGFFALGVGLLITLPMGSINIALAFKDMFGLNSRKEQEKGCVLC